MELPLNGRNLIQLLTLTGAGTTAPAGDLTGSKNMQGSNGSGTFAVAGSQANGVSYQWVVKLRSKIRTPNRSAAKFTRLDSAVGATVVFGRIAAIIGRESRSWNGLVV